MASASPNSPCASRRAGGAARVNRGPSWARPRRGAAITPTRTPTRGGQMAGTKPIPEGMHTLTPNLILSDCEKPGMGRSAPSAAQPVPVMLWLYVPDTDAAYRRAIDAGARSMMEPADMFWGDRCAGVADPFGYLWSFATRVKDLTPEEMKKAG